ncbi:unnamed protein product [Phaedon cochleariae]|uniref:Cyclin-dependent kinase inhibitor domain-containing protein n=1 Tax=Phaedon cochleariae TaxID=80249 RepID=A0A9N9SK57_PHACE|nr:unnamed protein product [Phaedon cochleariae]
MSTSVYKPLGLFLSKTPDKMLFCMPEVRKVKRVLFDRPDHVATQKFIDEELEKITVTESERWNFNFKTEKTLNPDGPYNWRPVTPQKAIRPIKRRPAEEEFDCQELYGFPREIIRPIPLKAVQEAEMESTSRLEELKSQPQRLITDFMPVKKRTSSEYTKKNGDWASQLERPSKLPRLSELTS